MMLALLLLGCGSTPSADPPVELHSATVDCIGMLYVPTGGPFGEQAVSRVWTYATGTSQIEHRCDFNWPEGVEGAGSLTAMRGDDVVAAINSKAPYANLTLRVAGREYNSSDGSLEFDHFEPGKASGTYDIRAVNLSGLFDPGEDWNADITGRFDWCDIRRTDCPYMASVDNLDRPFTLATDITHGEGQALDCRILHDATTDSIQVDLQMGTWQGINVSEYMLDACFDFGGNQPQGNQFTLRAGGVPGPGTYTLGPRRTLRYAGEDQDETQLQSFEWKHPAVFQDTLPGYALCEAYNRQAAVTSAADGGGCEYTVEDGRFAIDCDTVRYGGLGFSGQDTANTPFHLDAACDWVER